MIIPDSYIVVERLPKDVVTNGFETVEVQDNFVYKGRVADLPDINVHIGHKQLELGDVVLFAKYSPDTHEIEGRKWVRVVDLLGVL